MRLLAQQIPQQIQDMGSIKDMQQKNTYETAPNTAVVIVHAFAEQKPDNLDRSIRVDVTNLGNHLGVYMIVPGREKAVFTNTALGKYAITVTAVGYLSTRQEISFLSPTTQDVDIVLHRDPAAITLTEASGVMSSKAKKEAKRAVSSLKAGDLEHAEKHLNAAYESAPSNADLNFLLGYLHFQRNEYVKAATYLGTAAGLSPHSGQTLTLLGRTNLAQRNYPAARSVLEQAILVDSEDWLPHSLLADTYLREKEYSKARDEAQIAVAKSVRYGKSASGAAELTRGQALIALGQKKEGIQALQEFLKNSPPPTLVEPVHALITRVEQSAAAPAAASEISTGTADPLVAVPKVALSMQTWRPPDIDDVKSTVSPGVACTSAQVLAGAGQRAQELVQDVSRISAKEVLFHQSLDASGLSSHAETRKYDYVAAISSDRGYFAIDENRAAMAPQGGSPDGIASTGFIMLALVFHPEMQADFDFNCEGQSQWKGQPVWLVHFRQRHDRPNRMQSYDIGDKTYPVELKGRAWISADSFEIVRIEADMVKPIHEIQLLSEHQIVEYGPVPFAKKSTMLWLPTNAEIYLDFRKHHFYRRHSFDDYMLFDVGASQEDKLPPDTSTSAPTPPPGKGLTH